MTKENPKFRGKICPQQTAFWPLLGAFSACYAALRGHAKKILKKQKLFPAFCVIKVSSCYMERKGGERHETGAADATALIVRRPRRAAGTH